MTKLQQFLKHGAFTKSPPFFSKTTHLFTLAVAAISLQACHTPQQGTDASSQPPFTLLEASMQNWTAGREEGGRGTEYYFKVALHANKVAFDSIWVNNQVLPAFIAKETTTVSHQPITYAKGDTIIVRGSATAASPTGAPPAGYSGAAVVRYRVGKQPAYYAIEHIEKKTSQNLPTRN